MKISRNMLLSTFLKIISHIHRPYLVGIYVDYCQHTIHLSELVYKNILKSTII